MHEDSMGTLAEALERYRRDGYTDQFRVVEGGVLHATAAGRRYAPEQVRVDRVARFEGMSDPSDESAVFALTASDGVRGSYTVAYGPEMDPADAEMVARLDDRRRGVS